MHSTTKRAESRPFLAVLVVVSEVRRSVNRQAILLQPGIRNIEVGLRNSYAPMSTVPPAILGFPRVVPLKHGTDE